METRRKMFASIVSVKSEIIYRTLEYFYWNTSHFVGDLQQEFW